MYKSTPQQQKAKEIKQERIEDYVHGTLSKLKPKQRQFVCYFLLHGNQTKAAMQAGYKSPNKQGHRLRHTPKIAAVIDEFLHQGEMEAREVVQRISEQARGEYGRYLFVDLEGRVQLDVQKLLDEGKGHLISEIGYVGKDATQQVIKFYAADAALERLAKLHGMYKEQIDFTTAGSRLPGLTAADLAPLVEQARQELAAWRPQAEDSAASQPLTGEPFDEDTAASQPLTEEPFDEDTAVSRPLVEEQLDEDTAAR